MQNGLNSGMPLVLAQPTFLSGRNIGETVIEPLGSPARAVFFADRVRSLSRYVSIWA
jgi:hypothetical protein